MIENERAEEILLILDDKLTCLKKNIPLCARAGQIRTYSIKLW